MVETIYLCVSWWLLSRDSYVWELSLNTILDPWPFQVLALLSSAALQQLQDRRCALGAVWALAIRNALSYETV